MDTRCFCQRNQRECRGSPHRRRVVSRGITRENRTPRLPGVIFRDHDFPLRKGLVLQSSKDRNRCLTTVFHSPSKRSAAARSGPLTFVRRTSPLGAPRRSDLVEGPRPLTPGEGPVGPWSRRPSYGGESLVRGHSGDPQELQWVMLA